MRIVAALGGNALQRRGEAQTIASMRNRAQVAAHALAPLALEHELVVTHGNGPQVGALALQAAAAGDVVPFDVLGAESDGLIGYVLGQELLNALGSRLAVTVLTQTVVDENDRAFMSPSKPIGPVYAAVEARRLADANGWSVVPDGDGMRRAVASPAPRRIVEVDAIEALLDADIVPICAGGGGVPVVDRDGSLEGVEAVVDKDATSALLAEALGAQVLLLLTDVESIMVDWGTPAAQPLRQATPDALDQLVLPPGSMGPKASAAAVFVRNTGGRAVIGGLADALGAVEGNRGTQVRTDEYPSPGV